VAFVKPAFRKWILIVAALAIVILTHSLWLAALGGYLVKSDAPVRADIAVVLAGDFFGQRILTAASLVRQGYTSQVLVSSPEGVYGYYEGELEIPFAVRAGYPACWFIEVQNRARSTQEEALALAPELRKRGARTCLLVTSEYHTRRAGRLFRSRIPDVQFHVIAANDPLYDPAAWWHTREGRKIFAFEWMKTLAEWFGF
jgi:uncharacterized SAM-binding protein YcdF (DUF218 family)